MVDLETICNLCLILKTVMKIMSKSVSRHLVRLQGKLKITGKEKSYIFVSFYYIFSAFYYTIHRAISRADIG